jgi:hypothetical protein
MAHGRGSKWVRWWIFWGPSDTLTGCNSPPAGARPRYHAGALPRPTWLPRAGWHLLNWDCNLVCRRVLAAGELGAGGVGGGGSWSVFSREGRRGCRNRMLSLAWGSTVAILTHFVRPVHPPAVALMPENRGLKEARRTFIRPVRPWRAIGVRDRALARCGQSNRRLDVHSSTV